MARRARGKTLTLTALDAVPRSSVAVVIPCFEQGRFLQAAVRSACEQLPPPAEILVVDDGGTEDLAKILAPLSGVRIVRQDNRGLAAARNLGLANAASDKIIFLDADDRLLPGAVFAGLECFSDHPGAAFVYGGFEEVGVRGTEARFTPMHDRRDLLRCNWVAMIGTAMFDRRKLLAIGGFDDTLGMCEDWDAYLRLSRKHGFACHPRIVARYQKHGANMSDDIPQLRRWIDEVRGREWQRGLKPSEWVSWLQGAHIRDFYYATPRKRSMLERAHRRLSRALLGL